MCVSSVTEPVKFRVGPCAIVSSCACRPDILEKTSGRRPALNHAAGNVQEVLVQDWRILQRRAPTKIGEIYGAGHLPQHVHCHPQRHRDDAQALQHADAVAGWRQVQARGGSVLGAWREERRFGQGPGRQPRRLDPDRERRHQGGRRVRPAQVRLRQARRVREGVQSTTL